MLMKSESEISSKGAQSVQNGLYRPFVGSEEMRTSTGGPKYPKDLLVQ
jgi:hypothetical protein